MEGPGSGSRRPKNKWIRRIQIRDTSKKIWKMNDDIPNDSARAEEVVVGGAEALGVPVVPEPAQEQHDEDQHLQEKVN
jgi:hypothetical protein